MPVTLPIPHRIYSRDLEQGVLDVSGCRCPRCVAATSSLVAALQLTSARVRRRFWGLVEDADELFLVVEVVIELAIARCAGCGGRFRVLPCDLLPRKLYGLEVIEHTVYLHHKARSLRLVVWTDLGGERTPAPSTLHAWTEGIGAYVLGRPAGELPDAVPGSRVIAEAAERSAAARAASRERLPILAGLWRSEARRERILAGRRLLHLAAALGAASPRALAHLNGLILGWGSPSGLGFRTGFRVTPIEHPGMSARRSSSPTTTEEVPPCVIRGRSPPGDSNRSLHCSMHRSPETRSGNTSGRSLPSRRAGRARRRGA